MAKAYDYPEWDKSERDNEKILENLMIQYGKELVNLAFSYVHDWGRAEDIVQSVFLKCFQKMDSFRGDSTYKTWLYRITMNQCKDVMRTWAFRNIRPDSLESLFNVESHEPIPEEEIVRRRDQEELARLVFSLPVKYREVIMLHYYSDLKTEEIAQALKKNNATIRTRLHRARNLLKQKLEEAETHGR